MCRLLQFVPPSPHRKRAPMRSYAHMLTRSQPHTLTRSHAHTLTRSHAHTLTRSHAHTLTRSHSQSGGGHALHGVWHVAWCVTLVTLRCCCMRRACSGRRTTLTRAAHKDAKSQVKNALYLIEMKSVAEEILLMLLLWWLVRVLFTEPWATLPPHSELSSEFSALQRHSLRHASIASPTANRSGKGVLILQQVFETFLELVTVTPILVLSSQLAHCYSLFRTDRSGRHRRHELASYTSHKTLLER